MEIALLVAIGLFNLSHKPGHHTTHLQCYWFVIKIKKTYHIPIAEQYIAHNNMVKSRQYSVYAVDLFSVCLDHRDELHWSAMHSLVVGASVVEVN